MQEVSRLLSLKGLISTPYRPICNGLVERWNRTLKSMFKRHCQDQPKQWQRLINPVLFSYGEVPQESTGFTTFQLLYGRLVRGPGMILKELWTKEVNIPEVMSSYEYCCGSTSLMRSQVIILTLTGGLGSQTGTPPQYCREPQREGHGTGIFDSSTGRSSESL